MSDVSTAAAAPPPGEEERPAIEQARSIVRRDIPPVPPDASPDSCTIVLFYQYREPPWNAKEFKNAMSSVIGIAGRHGVTGRGRCAPEGLNCTLTGTPSAARAFCRDLRSWDSLFLETDFKFTDGLDPKATRFKALSLRKVDELVNYGLGGRKAPSLSRHAGIHLEADEYHEAMKNPDTVIIDVRNRYESDIGRFDPPVGGAELLDPSMRNSSDFQGWINAPETKEKLQGKKVMMYCTGGIRCERATALLNQIAEAEPEFKTQEVMHCRGGIERYLRTYPEGGFWKGANYLFDKRREQIPGKKSFEALQKDIKSQCCICLKPYASYHGQFKCHRTECRVPVIVCRGCVKRASENPSIQICPLCKEGYRAPTVAPDLIGQKRKLGILDEETSDLYAKRKEDGCEITESAIGKKNRRSPPLPSTRLFVGKLPLTYTASKLRRAVEASLDVFNRGKWENTAVASIRWIIDRTTGAYFGSAWVVMENLEDAEQVVRYCEKNGGLEIYPNATKNQLKKTRFWPRKARVAFAPLLDGEVFPVLEYSKDSEYPPIGYQ